MARGTKRDQVWLAAMKCEFDARFGDSWRERRFTAADVEEKIREEGGDPPSRRTIRDVLAEMAENSFHTGIECGPSEGTYRSSNYQPNETKRFD